MLKACDVRLHERLTRFARQHYGPHWLGSVLDEVELLDETTEVEDIEVSLVLPWLQHCLRDVNGETLADTWRRVERPRLTPDESAVLSGYDNAWLSVWEVVEVERGVGSRIIDQLTREERFVHDVKSSELLHRHDSILGIVLTFDSVAFFGGLHSRSLPPRYADTVIREARRLCRVRTRPVAPAKLRDFETQLDLMELWRLCLLDLLFQPPPVITNTDGELVVQMTDDFALVASRQAVAERLATLDGVIAPAQEEEDGLVFVVTKAGNAIHRSWDTTVIGRAVLSDAHLRVETNSTRRADSLRALVESHLKGMVRFRLRSEADLMSLLSEAPPVAEGERDNDPPPPEVAAVVRKFREQHMQNWLDESIPALGGLTPREAAKSKRGREQLALLLKEFEQAEDRLPLDERLDLRPTREALGNP